MKKYNIFISIILIPLALGIYLSTRSFLPIVDQAPGAGFWPRIIAITFVVLALVLVIETLLAKPQSSNDKPIEYNSPGMFRLYKFLGLIVLFVILLKFLGFLIAAVIVVPLLVALLGEKKILRLIIISLLLVFSIYAVFTWGLRIVLPQAFFV